MRRFTVTEIVTGYPCLLFEAEDADTLEGVVEEVLLDTAAFEALCPGGRDFFACKITEEVFKKVYFPRSRRYTAFGGPFVILGTDWPVPFVAVSPDTVEAYRVLHDSDGKFQKEYTYRDLRNSCDIYNVFKSAVVDPCKECKYNLSGYNRFTYRLDRHPCVKDAWFSDPVNTLSCNYGNTSMADSRFDSSALEKAKERFKTYQGTNTYVPPHLAVKSKNSGAAYNYKARIATIDLSEKVQEKNTEEYSENARIAAKTRIIRRKVCGEGCNACIFRRKDCWRWSNYPQRRVDNEFLSENDVEDWPSNAQPMCSRRWESNDQIVQSVLKNAKRYEGLNKLDIARMIAAQDIEFVAVNPETGHLVTVHYGMYKRDKARPWDKESEDSWVHTLVYDCISTRRRHCFDPIFKGSWNDLLWWIRVNAPRALQRFKQAEKRVDKLVKVISDETTALLYELASRPKLVRPSGFCRSAEVYNIVNVAVSKSEYKRPRVFVELVQGYRIWCLRGFEDLYDYIPEDWFSLVTT